METSMFETLFEKYPNQQWFTPKQVGDIIGRSDQYVRDAYDSGQLFGYLSNGKAAAKDQKKTYLIVHKRDICLFLLKGANFKEEDFMQILQSILKSCSTAQLFVLRKSISELLNK